MKLLGFHATVVELATREVFVRRTSTSALETRVKIMEFVSTTTGHILVNVDLDSAVKIASKWSTNVDHRLASTVVPVLRQKKVTLSASVEKVFPGNFAKLLRNVLTVLVTRNVWKVGVFVNTA